MDEALVVVLGVGVPGGRGCLKKSSDLEFEKAHAGTHLLFDLREQAHACTIYSLRAVTPAWSYYAVFRYSFTP